MKNLHIIGCGGLAKELIGYILGEPTQRYRIMGCWGDEPFNNKKYARFFSGNLKDFAEKYNQDTAVIIAIANSKKRREIVEETFNHFTVNYENYIHPSCEVSTFSEMGIGCVLAPQTIICADAVLKDHIFLNTECVVGHDTIIESYNCLYPKVEICGDCYVEEGCTFGIGSIVTPGVKIRRNSKLDAMSVLRNTINKTAMFVGNPAQAVRVYEDFE